ncbi:hypothetical protein [Bradyrhizobium ganzhouense]|uniref:hypothetical protein n=1 Tax=Bradyrhizobium ganzhouense TaxID=1179767 RepID=UPI003CED557E
MSWIDPPLDRGVQYASHVYRNALIKVGTAVSMSRKADCYDNAPNEASSMP